MTAVLAAAPPLPTGIGTDLLPVDFELPEDLIATEPVEAGGGGREDARLMVAHRDDPALVHTTFARLGDFLDPGDLLVVNTSATLPAAVPTAGIDDGLVVHLSTELPGGLWLVELRRPVGAGTEPFFDGEAGRRLSLPGGGSVDLLTPFPAGGHPARLWFAVLRLPAATVAYLARHGRPIRYGYVRRPFPISAYQTVFARQPGSAEMPSAGRPFTTALVTELVSRGVGVSPIVLHTGVSSAEPGELPYPERFRVPTETAERVNATRQAGHRVIAVGTTVTRALETAADERGRVHPAHGWTELVITPERGVKVVDGLVTGWHPPAGSHLMLVEAVAGRAAVERSYAAAVEERYRWHEFGDVHLVLPEVRTMRG
jgi:S-adenosylmethionine:tRNA ribosyltransferase-isomerase